MACPYAVAIVEVEVEACERGLVEGLLKNDKEELADFIKGEMTVS